jgi:membrane protein required for colicin V production
MASKLLNTHCVNAKSYYLANVNYLDFLILLNLGLAAWSGFKKGFVLEIFSLLAFFGGLFIAMHASEYATDWLRQNWEIKAELLPAAGFAVTFLGVAIGIHLIGRIVNKAIDLAALSLLNKAFGAVFGLVKMLLILGVVLLILESFTSFIPWPSEELKNGSLFYRDMQEIGLMVVPEIENSELLDQWKNADWIKE